LFVRKVSDSDLPSETLEPRSGGEFVTSEHHCREGKADSGVSGLKRGEGCFQFQLLRLNHRIKGIRKIFNKNNVLKNEYFNC